MWLTVTVSWLWLKQIALRNLNEHRLQSVGSLQSKNWHFLKKKTFCLQVVTRKLYPSFLPLDSRLQHQLLLRFPACQLPMDSGCASHTVMHVPWHTCMPQWLRIGINPWDSASGDWRVEERGGIYFHGSLLYLLFISTKVALSPLPRFNTASSHPLQKTWWQCPPHIVPGPELCPLGFLHTAHTFAVSLLNTPQLPSVSAPSVSFWDPKWYRCQRKQFNRDSVRGMWIKHFTKNSIRTPSSSPQYHFPWVPKPSCSKLSRSLTDAAKAGLLHVFHPLPSHSLAPQVCPWPLMAFWQGETSASPFPYYHLIFLPQHPYLFPVLWALLSLGTANPQPLKPAQSRPMVPPSALMICVDSPLTHIHTQNTLVIEITIVTFLLEVVDSPAALSAAIHSSFPPRANWVFFHFFHEFPPGAPHSLPP